MKLWLTNLKKTIPRLCFKIKHYASRIKVHIRSLSITLFNLDQVYVAIDVYINCNWRVYHLAYFAKSDVSSCFWSLLSRFSSVGVEICWKTLVRTNFCNCLNASSYISQKKLISIKPAQSNPFRNNKRSFSTNLTQLNNGMWKRHANLLRIWKVDGITPKQSPFTAIVCKWSFPMATKRKKK